MIARVSQKKGHKALVIEGSWPKPEIVSFAFSVSVPRNLTIFTSLRLEHTTTQLSTRVMNLSDGEVSISMVYSCEFFVPRSPFLSSADIPV